MVASRLLDAGRRVAVVARELIGGECGYWAWVPSKTLLRPPETRAEAAKGRALACRPWTGAGRRRALAAAERGADLDPEEFARAKELPGKERELVARLLSWVAPELEESIVALSAACSFDEAVFERLCERLKLRAAVADFPKVVATPTCGPAGATCSARSSSSPGTPQRPPRCSPGRRRPGRNPRRRPQPGAGAPAEVDGQPAKMAPASRAMSSTWARCL